MYPFLSLAGMCVYTIVLLCNDYYHQTRSKILHFDEMSELSPERSKGYTGIQKWYFCFY